MRSIVSYLFGAALLQSASAWSACQLLCDFETNGELGAWRSSTDGARVDATTDGVTRGRQAGVFVYPGSEKPSWPTIALTLSEPQDWSQLTYIGYHFSNLSKRTAWFWCQVASKDRRYGQAGFNVGGSEEGWTFFFLQDFADSADLKQVTEVRFMLARPKQEMRMAIDCVFVGDEIRSVTGFEEVVRLAPERATQQGLEGAFKETLLSLYGPGLVDTYTGLPYEFFSITERKPTQSLHVVHRSIGGDDTTEQHTPYMLYAMATRDPVIVGIEEKILDAMTTHLDPGDGLVGCYRWDFYERRLGPFWGWFGRPGGTHYQLSDAEHGAEVALYSLLPGAWFLGHEGALRSLELYARTMLKINSDPRFVHFHLFIGRNPDGTYVTYDWDGRSRYGSNLVDDPGKGYSDIMEFWWIVPMLGAAALTDDAELRRDILARVEPIMDNVTRFQQSDGTVATTYRLDGSHGSVTKPGYMYAGGSPPINWVRACYAMHALTGKRKHLGAAARYWKSPKARRNLSLMIFHSRYAKTAELATEIDAAIAKLQPDVKQQRRDERWATNLALASVYTGDPKYLSAALKWEERWRRRQYRDIAGYHYYFSRNTNHYVNRFAYKVLRDEGVTGHFISDHFRGPIVDLIVIKHLGSKTMGLVGRNLVELGWMLPNMVRAKSDE